MDAHTPQCMYMVCIVTSQFKVSRSHHPRPHDIIRSARNTCVKVLVVWLVHDIRSSTSGEAAAYIHRAYPSMQCTVHIVQVIQRLPSCDHKWVGYPPFQQAAHINVPTYEIILVMHREKRDSVFLASQVH
jgi:hypothetical protein